MKKSTKQALEKHHFHVRLQPTQRLTIMVAVALVLAIGLITAYSDQVRLGILGLFCQLLGAILLGFGLVKTNDELVEITGHYQELDRPTLVAHLAKDRFFVVIGVFAIVLGLLMQILGAQLQL